MTWSSSSSTMRSKPGICSRQLAAEAITPLTVVQAEAPLLERGGDGFRRIAEDVQLDLRAHRGRAVEDAADELRPKAVEHAHDVRRDQTQLGEPLIVSLGLEDSLPLDEPLLDLRVARQRARAGAHAEPLGGFPLGQREVLDAVLDHEPSGFLGELDAAGRTRPAGDDRRRPLITLRHSKERVA